jgi:hypothetical protein
LQRDGEDMSGALWALRGNQSCLSENNLQLRQDLCARHKQLGRAMALRESLQDTWEWPGQDAAEKHLKSLVFMGHMQSSGIVREAG